MRIAYFDCFSGISGDLMLGALIDAGLSLDTLRTELSKLPLSGYTLDVQKVYRQEIAGTQVVVLDHSPGRGASGNGHLQGRDAGQGSEQRRSASDLSQVITRSLLSEGVKHKAITAIELLAKAEARVNAIDAAHANLHEFAGIDTLVSIAGVIAGLSLLGIERVECSALNVGGGFLKTAGGVLPVPAPATAEILRQAAVPLYGTDANQELVTATGAAIIVAVAAAFGPMPSVTIDKLGYGVGRADITGNAHVLRVTIGDMVARYSTGSQAQPGFAHLPHADEEYITVIECTIDDTSPRQSDFLMERLFAEGALDVYMVPMRTRNNQPGTLLTVVCKHDQADSLSALIFEETSTLELRASDMARRTLHQDVTQVDTPFGPIKVVVARNDQGRVLHVEPEYDDVKKAALEMNVAVDVISEEARRAWSPSLTEAHQQIGRYRSVPTS
jgi:uncharacterized protein (TIGR00299 family) protein